MPTYPLTIREGHLLVDRGSGLELIDTGSPVSMPVPEIAREIVGADVVHLIGCDELARAPFVLDLVNDRVRFECTAEPPSSVGAPLPLGSVLGVPVLTVGTPSGDRAAFFDTGAPLCYGDPEDLEGIPVIGERDDFHPMHGAFRTTVRLVQLMVGDRAVTVEVGELPPMLAMLLGMTGTRWIVGPTAFPGRCLRVELGESGGRLWDLAASELAET